MVTSSIDSDTFAGFVEAVAHNLGDGSVRSDGFAAQAFLSRSQFDRVIRATAGEPPASFQRRVLLERAAFQLATSRLGILDIALEAGYSSHEAFVRAFRRAYGVNPSDWRESPRQIKLPTPNDVHFHPPGGLRLPTKKELTSMDLIVRMVEHHVWLVGEMLDRATRLADDQLDKEISISVEDVDERPDDAFAAVSPRGPDEHVEQRHPRQGLRLLDRGARVSWDNEAALRDGWTGLPGRGSPGRRRRPSGRHVRRRALHAGRDLHLRRDDRPRAQVRRASAGHSCWARSPAAGITDLGYGDPRKWVAEAA